MAKKKRTYVYLVKQNEPCEDSCMSCFAYSIESIWLDKAKAEKRAKELYKGYVDDYEVSE